MARHFMGVDPGQSGAIAVLTSAPDGLAITSPFKKMTDRDISDFMRWYATDTVMCLIEWVAARPVQGVSSVFKFGRHFGMLEGIMIAHDLRFERVTPKVWQGAMQCRTGGDKNVSKAKAQELFPQVAKVTHAIADALLIAEHCRRKFR